MLISLRRTRGASEDGLGRLRDVRREVKPPNLYYGGITGVNSTVLQRFDEIVIILE